MKTTARTKRLVAGILVVLLLTGVSSSLHPQAALASPGSSDQVVLILAPYLSWDDISAQKTPALYRAAQNGSIGDINARSRVRPDQGVLAERALTIGAGSPVLVDPAAWSAFDRDETFLGNPVSAVTPTYLQAPLGENSIAYLGLPRTLAANTSNNFGSLPGLLGSTITGAGAAVAAIGNSDIKGESASAVYQRPAALLAMDRDGFVRLGDVSGRLLKADVGAPFGLRSDEGALARAMEDTRTQIEGSGATKSLVVIDPGDLYRAQQSAGDAASQLTQQQWAAALSGLDSCYTHAREIWPQATIMVSAVATRDKALKTDSFGPLIISEASPQAGILASASTHRSGLVTDLDLAPSILAILGIPAPVQMVGSPVTVGQTSAATPASLSSRIGDLTRMNATAVSVESIRVKVINAFVIATVLIILLGAIFVLYADRLFSRTFTRICKWIMYALILFILALPTASWLMFFLSRWPATPAAVIGEFLATALGLWACALLLAWKGSKRLPLIALITTTTLVIIIDQLLGAPASFTSIFGYSPIAAARYYGMGNEAAAIMVGAVMIGCGLLVDQYPQARWMPYFKRYGVAVLGLLTMFAAAAPMLGANAGVSIWATVGFIALWLLLNAKRFSWKSALVMVGAVAAVVALFILADLLLPGKGTHLGRLVVDTSRGGVSQLWIMIARKIATNLRVFAVTNWAYILIAVIAYLVVLGLRPTGDFAVAMKDNPAFHKALISVLFTGIVAFFTEDSGIVLPSLMVIYLGASIVWLMLGPVTGATKEERVALRRVHLQREIEALESATGDQSEP